VPVTGRGGYTIRALPHLYFGIVSERLETHSRRFQNRIGLGMSNIVSGRQIQAARMLAGLTQADLARAETRSIDIQTFQQTRAKAARHIFRLPIVQKNLL